MLEYDGKTKALTGVIKAFAVQPQDFISTLLQLIKGRTERLSRRLHLRRFKMADRIEAVAYKKHQFQCVFSQA